MPNNTNTTVQTLIDQEIVRNAAEAASAPEVIVEEAIRNLELNPTAIYDDEVIAALRVIRQKTPVQYIRIVQPLTGYKTDLNELTKPSRDDRENSDQSVLIALAREHCQFGHDRNAQAVAIVVENSVRKVWMVRSSSYSDWLRAIFYGATRRGIGDATLSAVAATLFAIGVHEGDLFEVHLRCAKHEGNYYIDLCNDSWQVVRISNSGWCVLDQSPVMFTRTNNMRELPLPEGDGDFDTIWKYVNVPERQRTLLLTWMIDSCRPDTPFPLFELCGEQGTAKSSSQRFLRDLLDPNKVNLRGRPRSVEDIFVAADNNWMPSFENLSGLSREQQDALCTVSTGGGFATRQLYTNGDEFVLESKRPVMLNGINRVATQPDLIERAITIEAPIIPPGSRVSEQDLSANWSIDRKSIFIGFLDRFSAALYCLQNIQITNVHRMADFQLLGEAVCHSLGNPDGYFSEIFEEIINSGSDAAMECYGVANAVQVLLAGRADGVWQGTYLMLLDELSRLHGIDRSFWPKSSRNLSGQLKRLMPGLRRQGIEISNMGHTRRGSEIRITQSRGADE